MKKSCAITLCASALLVASYSDALINPSIEAPEMRRFMGIPTDNPLPLLHAIEVQVRVLDKDWDPEDGIFDPELAARPGALSNVENGYGLWGSVGLYQYTWIAPPQGAPPQF